MKLILIAAHDPNLVIGKDGELPWHYKEDLQFFKKMTMGSPLIMGRIVFEELGEKPLPGRKCLVLSRSRNYDHVDTFNSIQDAIQSVQNEEKVFIIGGGEIYRNTIGQADQLIITEIKESYEGDTFFPEYRDEIGETWKESRRENHKDFSFVIYDRIS